MPQLSVIIPALNESGHILNTLSDLEEIRRAGHEIIVVDGGSTDNTKTLARGHADKVVESPGGRARQMNAGARQAQGDVLWFLHADTKVPGDALAAIIHSVAEGKVWGRFNVRLSGRQWMFRVIERMMNLRSCMSGIATGDQGIFVTRKYFNEVGGFPDITLMEDIALSRRLKRLSRPVCLKQRLITSSRRWEQEGIWRTIFLMWRLRLAYALGANPEDLTRRYYP